MDSTMMYDADVTVGPIGDELKLRIARRAINVTVPHGIKAIFFDLHGVLVDVSEWHRVALLSALQDFGQKNVPIPRNHEVWSIHTGTRNQIDYLRKIGWLNNSNCSKVLSEAIYQRKQQYTHEFIEKRCRPESRIIDVMEYLKSVGFRLAVVTNGNRANTEKMLKASRLYDYFEFIITREDVGDKVKPHPRPYLEARYRMKLGHKEALVVDDTWRGISSGGEARCRTWKLDSYDELSVRNLMSKLSSYRIVL